MKKLLSLLILTSFFSTTFAMQEEPQDKTSQDKKEIISVIDDNKDGNPEIGYDSNTGEIIGDINSDGKEDFRFSLKKLLANKYITAACITAALIYGTDYTLKFFDLDIPVINYVGGDLTTATLEKLSKYGPEVWIFIKEAFPKLWNKISELRTNGQEA